MNINDILKSHKQNLSQFKSLFNSNSELRKALSYIYQFPDCDSFGIDCEDCPYQYAHGCCWDMFADLQDWLMDDNENN
jgi:hypothetical protein